MKTSFILYVIFYCLPLSVILFTDDDSVHRFMLQIATVPALLLFLVELIQIQEQGSNYFGGWNNCDFS
jgi:uncharacterized membrane protein